MRRRSRDVGVRIFSRSDLDARSGLAPHRFAGGGAAGRRADHRRGGARRACRLRRGLPPRCPDAAHGHHRFRPGSSRPRSDRAGGAARRRHPTDRTRGDGLCDVHGTVSRREAARVVGASGTGANRVERRHVALWRRAVHHRASSRFRREMAAGRGDDRGSGVLTRRVPCCGDARRPRFRGAHRCGHGAAQRPRRGELSRGRPPTAAGTHPGAAPVDDRRGGSGGRGVGGSARGRDVRLGYRRRGLRHTAHCTSRGGCRGGTRRRATPAPRTVPPAGRHRGGGPGDRAGLPAFERPTSHRPALVGRRHSHRRGGGDRRAGGGGGHRRFHRVPCGILAFCGAPV